MRIVCRPLVLRFLHFEPVTWEENPSVGFYSRSLQIRTDKKKHRMLQKKKKEKENTNKKKTNLELSPVEQESP